jgi:hypothetical protein
VNDSCGCFHGGLAVACRFADDPQHTK